RIARRASAHGRPRRSGPGPDPHRGAGRADAKPVGADAATGTPGSGQYRPAEPTGRAGAAIGSLRLIRMSIVQRIQMSTGGVRFRIFSVERITFAGPFSPPPEPWKGNRMSKWQTAEVATPAQLDELIEEATVDCYDEEEQASGFYAIIDDNLALP